MKSSTQRTAIIALLMLIAWLLYGIGIEVKRVVLVEQHKDTGATDTKPTAPASDEKTISFARASSL